MDVGNASPEPFLKEHSKMRSPIQVTPFPRASSNQSEGMFINSLAVLCVLFYTFLDLRFLTNRLHSLNVALPSFILEVFAK